MITRVLLGFIAAVLAVLLVHQPIIAALTATGALETKGVVYNFAPLTGAPLFLAQFFGGLGIKGWPILFNQMFWGGMWGVLFGAMLVPLSLPNWFKGLLLGLLVVILGNWLLIPLLKSQPLFGGFDIKRMAITCAIGIPFGIATGLIYGLMRRHEA